MKTNTAWYGKYLAFIQIDKFIKKHQWTAAQINESGEVFERFLQIYRSCGGSVAHPCEQIYVGYEPRLNYQPPQSLSVLLAPCVHRQFSISRRKIKKNLIYYDFADKYLSLDITDQTMVKAHPKDRQLLFKKLAQFPNKGVYLYGPSKSGKTYIYMAYAVYLAKRFPKKKIAFVNVVNLVNIFRQEQKELFKSTKLLLPVLKSVDVLFLDDLGVEKWSKWLRDHLFYYLFNYFLINKKTLFVNSNLSPRQFCQKLEIENESKNQLNQIATQRVINRIEQLTDPFELK